MDFILPFPLKQQEKQISVKQALLLMGSCFAEEIGKKLRERKFNALVNPHGISYNPSSLSNAITDYIEGKNYQEEDLLQHNELWQSFNHHGKFSSRDPKTCLKSINEEISK